MARSPSAAMEPWGSSEGALPKKMAMFGSRWNNSETIIYIYRLYIIYLFKYNLYIIYIIIYIHGFVSWNVGFGLILVGIFAKFDAWKGQSYPLTIILWRYPRGFSANMGDFTTPFGGGLDHFQTDPNIRLFGISDTQIVRIPGKVLLYPSMFHVMHIINMYKYVCKCHL